jgi:hypothetical protein
VAEVLRNWVLSTVDLLKEDAVRPEVFGLLVSLCKLGDKLFMDKLKESLRAFCGTLIKAFSSTRLNKSVVFFLSKTKFPK